MTFISQGINALSKNLQLGYRRVIPTVFSLSICMTAKDNPKKRKLSPQQELFCLLYVKDKECFSNATRAYVRAYDVKSNQVDSARKSSSRLLINVDIAKRIASILDGCLDREIVDRELSKIILQDFDLSAKVAGIREYNRIRSRITDRLEGNFTFSWEGE